MTRQEIFDKVAILTLDLDRANRDDALTAVTEATAFAADLTFDSLDNIEFVMAVEDAFAVDVTDEEASHWLTIGDAVDFVLKAKSEPPMAATADVEARP